jgi:hypothetical protein
VRVIQHRALNKPPMMLLIQAATIPIRSSARDGRPPVRPAARCPTVTVTTLPCSRADVRAATRFPMSSGPQARDLEPAGAVMSVKSIIARPLVSAALAADVLRPGAAAALAMASEIGVTPAVAEKVSAMPSDRPRRPGRAAVNRTEPRRLA